MNYGRVTGAGTGSRTLRLVVCPLTRFKSKGEHVVRSDAISVPAKQQHRVIENVASVIVALPLHADLLASDLPLICEDIVLVHLGGRGSIRSQPTQYIGGICINARRVVSDGAGRILWLGRGQVLPLG